MAEGKYFWLKLKRDFFKRHDIRVIEGLDNGKDYLLFYLKLLCESVDHEGNLRFSDQIPYNEKMLSTITDTNIDIVRSAIDIFTQLGMMEIMDDGTYFMSEVNKMLGSSAQDEHTRESTRLRVQAYRERQKGAKLEDKRYSNVTCNGELEKEIEIDKDINNIPAPKERIHRNKLGEYKHVLLSPEEVRKLIADYGEDMTRNCITFLDEYIEMKGYKAKSHYLCIRKWVVDAVKEHSNKANRTAKKNHFNDLEASSYTSMSNDDLEELVRKSQGG